MNVDLRNIKEGDLVAYYPWSYGERAVEIRRVGKVTGKTRRFIHLDSQTFRMDGSQTGDNWRKARIGPVTDEARQKAAVQRTKSQLEAALRLLKPNEITHEQRTALLEALRPFLPTPEQP